MLHLWGLVLHIWGVVLHVCGCGADVSEHCGIAYVMNVS